MRTLNPYSLRIGGADPASGGKGVCPRTKEKAITPLLPFPLDKLRHLWSSKSPFLLFAIKSALVAGFSWEVAYSLIGREAASLAVVSAIFVVQVNQLANGSQGH